MEVTQYLFESEVLQHRTRKKKDSYNQPLRGRLRKAAAKPQRRGKKRLGALKTLMHIHST